MAEASKKAVREALIQFMVNASSAIKEAYCFTVKGELTAISLMTLMFLDPEEYAAALLTLDCWSCVLCLLKNLTSFGVKRKDGMSLLLKHLTLILSTSEITALRLQNQA